VATQHKKQTLIPNGHISVLFTDDPQAEHSLIIHHDAGLTIALTVEEENALLAVLAVLKEQRTKE